jgi:hypothetical protein
MWATTFKVASRSSFREAQGVMRRDRRLSLRVFKPVAGLAFLACSLMAGAAQAEESATGSSSASRPFSVGTSMFTLMNLVPMDEPPHFYQLNFGYQLTSNDRLSVEAMTWRYYRPLGIPYGEAYESPDEAYPGHIREYGIGLDYQRILWNGVYSSLTAVPFWREYYDTHNRKIGNGSQLFLTLRFGYHFLIKDRVFIEPSIAFTCWPVKTNVPESFAAMDRKWPSYFLFEPGLHFGIVF